MARLDKSSSRPVHRQTSRPAAKPAPAKRLPGKPATPGKTLPGKPATAGWSPDAARRTAAETAARVLGGGTTVEQSGRNSVVTRDAPDVNNLAGISPASIYYQQTQAASKALAPEESRALAALPPTAQARYSAVLNAAGQKNPVVRLAMQSLLLSGKLQQNDSHGHPLLQTLATLSDPKTPLAAGLQRATLVGELVQELATPSAIDQSNRNTCGPTTVAIFTATTRPAEYARLVAGLASPAGAVDLVAGALQRLPGTTTEDGSHRSSVQRLLEPALMDFGNGALGYDNLADKHTVFGLPTFPGALPSMVARMLTGIMGRQAESSLDPLGHPGKKDVATLERLTAAGTPVPTMIDYKSSGLVPAYHWVLATHLDAKSVTFVNPWGREETMPRAEYDGRLKGLALPG